MSEKVRVIRQPGVENSGGQEGVFLVSKWFFIQASESSTVIVHEDYLNITAEDINEFIRFCKGRTSPVITGCRAEIHPYRLLFVTDDGFFKPYADVPQAVRGNRHRYPEVYRAVPAMVFYPAGTGPELFHGEAAPLIYVMEKEKLLDKTRFPDMLFL